MVQLLCEAREQAETSQAALEIQKYCSRIGVAGRGYAVGQGLESSRLVYVQITTISPPCHRVLDSLCTHNADDILNALARRVLSTLIMMLKQCPAIVDSYKSSPGR